MTGPGRRRKGELRRLRRRLEALHFEGKGGLDGDRTNLVLAELIDEALGFPAPEGSPDEVEAKAADYRGAAGLADEIRGGVRAVATAGLPDTWVGEAGSKASEVTKAAARNAEHMSETFGTAARELTLLAEGIGTAQRKHGFGLDALRAARGMLPEGDSAYFSAAVDAHRARRAALDGIGYLESGVEAAEAAGERAERKLNELAADVRSGRLDTRHLSDADRVVLADAAAHGGHPGDPDHDNGAAFEERLRAEETRVYDRREGDKRGMNGLESEMVADDEIGSHTGTDYEAIATGTKESWEEVPPKIREAVDSGQPVPFGARQGDEFGHQMMIIGQDGGKLQIYNPWGFTTWVSEDDFVNGTVGGASSEKYPTPTDIRLPEQKQAARP